MSSSLNWRKSSYSLPEGQNCVEVADHEKTGFTIRDSKNPDQGNLFFTNSEWIAFLAAFETENDH